MASEHEATQLAIDRLAPVLEKRLPSLSESLNPPASEADLDVLRRAIAPFELPAELETWLRFADGQRFDVIAVWPTFDFCPFWPAEAIAREYPHILQFQPPGLLPLGYQSHYQVSIELAGDGSHSLIETSVDSGDWRVVVPSIADMADVIRELLEAGEIDDWPFAGPAFNDVAVYQARISRYQAQLNPLLEQLDWSSAPFPLDEWFGQDVFPARWGPIPAV
jgi:hypothetical protein